MKKLKELVSRVLKVNPEELNDESSPETIESWDSFNGLMLVSELERNFNVKFSSEEITSVKKFKDISDALKTHGVSEDLIW